MLLDGEADPRLDVDGREPRGLREHHHLRVGDVGEGVDGEPGPRHAARDGEHGGDDEDQEAVAEDPLDRAHGAP